MTETRGDLIEKVRSLLSQDGFAIVARDGFGRLIISTDPTLVLRVFEICAGEIQRPAGVLIPAPETASQTDLFGVGIKS